MDISLVGARNYVGRAGLVNAHKSCLSRSTKACQTELDAIVGRPHMPTFANLPHLHYICTMVKEALQWKPVKKTLIPYWNEPFGL
jgi:hypothetical protein